MKVVAYTLVVLTLAVCCTGSRVATPIEVDALKALYYSTGGPTHWIRHDGWFEGDPCTNSWYGVTCHEDETMDLELHGNNLSGSIPKEIEGLRLRRLQLQQNQIEGTLPAVAVLEMLNVEANKFVGRLPEDLAGLETLEVLTLSGNSFEDPLPSRIALATNLRKLVASNNSFRGTLPIELASLSLLEYLDLSANKLTGPLWMAKSWQRLQHLNVSRNMFSGPIDSFAQRDWSVLDLSSNLFSGFAPSNWSTQPSWAYSSAVNGSNFDISCNCFEPPPPAWCLDTWCSNCNGDMCTEEMCLDQCGL